MKFQGVLLAAVALMAACQGAGSSSGVARIRVDLTALVQAQQSDQVVVATVQCDTQRLVVGPFPLLTEASFNVPACGAATIEIEVRNSVAASYLAVQSVTLIDGQVTDVLFPAYPAGTVRAVSEVACLLMMKSRRSESDAPRERSVPLLPKAPTLLTVLAGEQEVRCLDDGGFDRFTASSFTVQRDVENLLRLEDSVEPPAPGKPPSIITSTIAADRTAGIAPDGVDLALVEVTVRDEDGVALSSIEVNATTPDGLPPFDMMTSDADGRAKFSVRSVFPGVRIVSIAAGGVDLGTIAIAFIDNTTVQVNSEFSPIQAIPYLLADAVDTVEARVVARDDSNNIIVGALVMFSVDSELEALTPLSLYTGPTGEAKLTVRTRSVESFVESRFLGLNCTINNTELGLRNIEVRRRHVDDTLSSFVAPVSYPAANGSPATAVLTLRDQKGRPIVGQSLSGATVPSSPANGFASFVPFTDNNGQAVVAYGTRASEKVRFSWSAFFHDTNHTFYTTMSYRPAIAPLGVTPSAPTTPAVNLGSAPRISGDGRYVVFATDLALVQQDTNGVSDVYRYGILDSELRLISVDRDGLNAANGESIEPDLSYDGSRVTFASLATNIGGIAQDANALFDIYLRDVDQQASVLVSVGAGDLAMGNARRPAIVQSADPGFDGAHLAFDALVASTSQVYRAIPDLGVVPATLTSAHVSLVSKNTGVPGAAESSHASIAISGEGNSMLAFESLAGDLTAQNYNGSRQIVTCDLGPSDNEDPTCVLVTEVAGAGATQDSFEPHVSGDSQRVAYVSAAALGGETDPNGVRLDIYMGYTQDPTVTHTIRCAFNATGSDCKSPRLSHDGRYVVFQSAEAVLGGAELDGALADQDTVSDVFAYDREFDQLRLLSERDNGLDVAAPTHVGGISADGSRVSLLSAAPLTDTPHQGTHAAYVAPNPLATGFAVLASGIDGTFNADADTFQSTPDERHMSALDAPAISEDGRYMAFTSRAKLDPSIVTWGLCAAQRCNDVYWADLLTNVVRLVSRRASTPDQGGTGESRHPGISRDGRYVVFDSDVPDLMFGVPAFPQGQKHVYRYDTETSEMAIVDLNVDGVPPNANSQRPVISQNGNVIAFESNTAPFWFSATASAAPSDEIYVRYMDRTPGNSSLLFAVSRTSGGAFVGQASSPSLSYDGTLVAFESGSSLVALDSNSTRDVYLRSLNSSALELVSRTDTGSSAAGESRAPQVSGLGGYVVFESAADLTVGFSPAAFATYTRKVGAPDNAIDIVSRDNAGVAIVPVASCSSATSVGVMDRVSCSSPSISADGRYVSFMSDRGQTEAVTPLPPTGPGAGVMRAYVFDRGMKQVSYAQGRAPIDPTNIQHFTDVTNSNSYMARLSGDARHLGVLHSGLDYGFGNQGNNILQTLRISSPYFAPEGGEVSGPSF